MVARKLHEAEARWMLTGSTAALVYGHQRTTVDIDVVIDMDTVDADALVEAFQPEFFLDRQMVVESARTGTLFNALPLTLGPKIDLIPLNRTDPLNELAFDTRELLEWGDMPVWVSSLPALVLNKLRWARDSGSERQLADVRTLLDLEPLDDDESFCQWVAQLGLQEQLDAARTVRYDP